MVRLKDIALRAGVSVMTVSKVLRDAPDISPATKARVKMLADEMGYVPDSLAQGLRTRTTRTIGLVISTVTNPILARAIVAIEEQAYELGYEVILAHSLNDPTREETVIRRLAELCGDELEVHHRVRQGALEYEGILDWRRLPPRSAVMIAVTPLPFNHSKSRRSSARTIV